ncbi:hypothetical protein CYY_004409 [Polysphondylium violaceum]|uniref:NmrA-like domain-containing protein n=1 Tax=Polysphondylium violaceum TaxID=133409 RepID=A0A8J4Q5E6_9MYCE|nr:hypothetical protein CYY_004409 [Polysphondylium violaceum]
MSTKSVISVFGSTGAQGGSVLNSLLLQGKFQLRALTRDVDSEKAQALKQKGVELVKIDLSDSAEEIQKALQGSHGVFLVTPISPNESEHGKKVAQAAKDANVKHFVFSSLSHVKKITNGRLEVPHFDSKAEVEEFARKLSLENPGFVSSFVYIPFYAQNLNTWFVPRKDQNGDYSITLPLDPAGKPLEVGDVKNVGPIVAEIFTDAKKYSGVAIPFAGSVVTPSQLVESVSKNVGQPVKYNYVPPSVYGTFPFPFAKEMANMFQFYSESGAFPKLDLSIAPKITKLTTLDEYLAKNPIKLE